jgi:alpha-L-fucosidase 2
MVQSIREYICSHPHNVCSHMTSSSKPIPEAIYSLKTTQGHSNFQKTCQGESTLLLRARAGLENASILYEIMGTITGTSGSDARISCEGGVITLSNATDIWFLWTGGTEYSIDAGTAEAGFKFKGQDPHDSNAATLASIRSTSYTTFMTRHVADYVRGTSRSFHLDLGQQVDWSRSKDELLVAYQNGKSFVFA